MSGYCDNCGHQYCICDKNKRNKYYCKHCGKTFIRDSEKAWIKSWCDTTHKEVRIIKVK